LSEARWQYTTEQYFINISRINASVFDAGSRYGSRDLRRGERAQYPLKRAHR
jgi:hypothetical protein